MNDQLSSSALSKSSDLTTVALNWGSFGDAIKGAGDVINSATEAVQEFVEPITESASQFIQDTLGSVENSDNQIPQVQPPGDLTEQFTRAAQTVVDNVKVHAQDAQKNILGFTKPLSDALNAAKELVLPSENKAVSAEPEPALADAGIAGTLSLTPTLALPEMAPVARAVSTFARVAGPYAVVAGVTQYFINEGIKLDGEAKTAESSALQAQMDAQVRSAAYARGMKVEDVGNMMAGRPVIAKQRESGILTGGFDAIKNSANSLASEAQKLEPLKAETGEGAVKSPESAERERLRAPRPKPEPESTTWEKLLERANAPVKFVLPTLSLPRPFKAETGEGEGKEEGENTEDSNDSEIRRRLEEVRPLADAMKEWDNAIMNGIGREELGDKTWDDRVAEIEQQAKNRVANDKKAEDYFSDLF
jgi:hypothetical protein